MDARQRAAGRHTRAGRGGPGMRLDEWIDGATATLRAAGVLHAHRDALLLAAHVLELDKTSLLAHPETELTGDTPAALARVLARRTGREPLQYIVGRQEFWGMPVRVGPGCLIPRPETEHVVETTLELIAAFERPAVAEIGTGSGCILMALATERPDARLTGIEMDPEAMAWARLNLSDFPGVRLLAGDVRFLPPVDALHAVVSNPPYVTDDEWATLEPEVRAFEPAAALRCGNDPMGPYGAVAEWAVRSLLPGGVLVCELGVAQARRASGLRRLHPGLSWENGVRDLAGRLRVAVWRKSG